MTKIYLLQNYKSNVENSIIEVSDEEATKLIGINKARLLGPKDYLIKPKTTIKNIVTRAFGKRPND